MALRIRSDGRILCAALHNREDGDTYIDDNLHYEMSVVHKVIVTEPMPEHTLRGEWWWTNQVPREVIVDDFYKGWKTHFVKLEMDDLPIALIAELSGKNLAPYIEALRQKLKGSNV